MKREIEKYRNLEKDLIRQINLCKKYKVLIGTTLRELNNLYQSGTIDLNTYNARIYTFLQGRSQEEWYGLYDTHIKKCYYNLGYYKQKTNEITASKPVEKRILFHPITTFFALFLALAIFASINPAITGLFGYEDVKEIIVAEDGYTTEGSRWMDINGERVYERCMKVTASDAFDAVKIIAKITTTGENKDLTLKLYTHNEQEDEPSTLTASCKVNSYENIWKSCTVKNIQQEKNDYWVCAANPQGDSEETYYTIAYQIGDNRKTALWTGEYWQKLERSSYTIKAQFMKNEK